MRKGKKGVRAREGRPERTLSQAIEALGLRDDLEDLQVKVLLVEERVDELERSLSYKAVAREVAGGDSTADSLRGVK